MTGKWEALQTELRINRYTPLINRCWSNHGPQTQHGADAATSRHHGNGSSPEAAHAFDVNRHYGRLELQGWL
ncbi:hypothetical protein PBY51_007486 [Eleginops maclovinus]|uniref:Uncharacterized protein n=1 Tax=Eleginops maclovinus TaxID=56733 RepID=A0AAN7X7P1_ELEMC|nr:hypothetical protein PBY51_007486 [Eleginops maclovinus]